LVTLMPAGGIELTNKASRRLTDRW
jgi:hypothetical protein